MSPSLGSVCVVLRSFLEVISSFALHNNVSAYKHKDYLSLQMQWNIAAALRPFSYLLIKASVVCLRACIPFACNVLYYNNGCVDLYLLIYKVPSFFGRRKTMTRSGG